MDYGNFRCNHFTRSMSPNMLNSTVLWLLSRVSTAMLTRDAVISILFVSVCPSVRLSVVCPVPLFIETAYRVVILSSEYYGSHPIHSSFRHFCEIPTGSALRGRRIRCVFKFRDSLPIDRNQGWQPRVWQPRVSPMFPSCKKLSPWKLSHREYFCFRQRTPPPVSHMLPRENLFPWKFTVITLCALLTRDLR